MAAKTSVLGEVWIPFQLLTIEICRANAKFFYHSLIEEYIWTLFDFAFKRKVVGYVYLSEVI